MFGLVNWQMYIEGMSEYKDYVDIKNVILMERNEFVRAEVFFILLEGRIGVLFFHRNRHFGDVCQLTVSYVNSTK